MVKMAGSFFTNTLHSDKFIRMREGVVNIPSTVGTDIIQP